VTTDKDRRSLAALLVPVAAMFLGLRLFGRAVFWGDLTYIHHPWRALQADQLQRGLAPLWDPYAYLGMPLAAQMQGAVWYPGSLPFHLFGFAEAAAVFHAAHYCLAAFLAYLWLRRLGSARAAAMAGATLFSLSGALASRVPFLNHLSTLAWLPGLLLFADRPWLLGLTLATAFLSGYPLMLAGGAVSAFWLTSMLRRRGPPWRAWIAGGALSLTVSAVLLIPAARLASDSQRGGGLPVVETLEFALTPSDLPQLVGPIATGPSGFDPARSWWKTCYMGAAGVAAAALSAGRVGAGAALAAGGQGGTAILLMMGGATPVSRWVWERVPPFRYVRYPGNLAYLLLAPAALLVAAGLHRRAWAGRAWLLLAVELGIYGLASQPVVSADFFTDAGPLVRELQRGLAGGRYLLSPRALEWHRGVGGDTRTAAADLKHRLYGLTGVPYRLSSVGNFGEPLVPRPCYDLMDFLYRRAGLADAAPYLPWADVRELLTRERFPPWPLAYGGRTLWHRYRVPGPHGRARWFPPEEGGAIPSSLEAAEVLPDLRSSVPLAVERGRDDRLVIRGGADGPGWLYLAEPRLPGWEAWLGPARVGVEPAMGAFAKTRVPAGEWVFRWLYRPADWRWGLLLSLAAMAASAAYWYNRLLARRPRLES